MAKKKRKEAENAILKAFDEAAETGKLQILAFMEGYNFRKEVEGRKPQ